MGQVIVFVNQKGGVGKTTTTVNVGAYMAEAGKKVLLVDFDPQGNLSSSLGVKSETGGVYSAITGEITPEEAIVSSEVKNLDVLPSNLHLSGAAVELVNADKREYRLKGVLDQVKANYDYVLIDCPPSLGLLTINGFVASDSIIIPLQCEFFALEGFLTMLFNTVKRLQKTFNPSLKIAGIVFTMYDSRTNLSNEVIQTVKNSFKQYPNLLFKTVIPRNVKLSEAPSHGVPINLYDRNCVGAKSYEKLTAEVMANG